ncbi:MAG: condensation domain-containing protein, partial [Pyrinomonadaceae bacterium]
MSRQNRRSLGLSAKKRALFNALLDKEGVVSSVQTITRREQSGPCVLSFAQQRLWFLDQMEPNSSFYNVPFVLTLSGELNIEALERSLTEIIRRHEVLRTSFRMIDGQPMQVVNTPPPVKLQVHDLSHLPEAGRVPEAKRVTRDEAQRPFSLADDSLLRFMLMRLGEQEHKLLLTIHHIVADAWSIAILARELHALYGAYAAGEESPLPELPIQYADYAVWQREWLQDKRLEQQLDYWKGQLAEVPLIEIPTDFPRPVARGYRGKLTNHLFGKSVSDGLNTLCQREGVTLFMTLLAA